MSFDPLSDPARCGLITALFLKGANGGLKKFEVTQQKPGLKPDSRALASVQPPPLEKGVGKRDLRQKAQVPTPGYLPPCTFYFHL